MKVGDKITFRPSFDSGTYEKSEEQRTYVRHPVTGTIVGHNRAHRFYRVEFEIGGTKFHECFKFIPENNSKVKPCKRDRWGEIEK